VNFRFKSSSLLDPVLRKKIYQWRQALPVRSLKTLIYLLERQVTRDENPRSKKQKQALQFLNVQRLVYIQAPEIDNLIFLGLCSTSNPKEVRFCL